MPDVEQRWQRGGGSGGHSADEVSTEQLDKEFKLDQKLLEFRAALQVRCRALVKVTRTIDSACNIHHA